MYDGAGVGRDPTILVAVDALRAAARAGRRLATACWAAAHQGRLEWPPLRPARCHRRHQRRLGLQHPRGLLRGLRRRGNCPTSSDFLRQNFQNSLILQALPGSLQDLTSPWYGRSHLLARRLDEIYEGKTYADIERNPRHPQLVIAATDMSLGTPFEFTADQFELICSDLQSVPLSFAVAASSAVPILLSL